jgi:hypothetical protein
MWGHYGTHNARQSQLRDGNAGLRGGLGQGEHVGVTEPLPAAAGWQSWWMLQMIRVGERP